MKARRDSRCQATAGKHTPESTDMRAITRQQHLLTLHTTKEELLEAKWAREHKRREVSIIESRYQATTGEDIEHFMCAAVQWFVECIDMQECYIYLQWQVITVQQIQLSIQTPYLVT
jgi:homoserine acetyltransferase